jgi:hypothetical protein
MNTSPGGAAEINREIRGTREILFCHEEAQKPQKFNHGLTQMNTDANSPQALAI